MQININDNNIDIIHSFCNGFPLQGRKNVFLMFFKQCSFLCRLGIDLRLMFDMFLNKFVNAICLISFTEDSYQEDTLMQLNLQICQCFVTF